MKKLIYILVIVFLMSGIRSFAQDPSPLPSVTIKKLIAPNNPTFYYNTLDSALWVFKGKTGWLRIASNNQIIRVQAAINYLDGKDVNSVSVTGTGTKTITVARVNGSTLTATFEDAGGTQLQSDWTQTNTLSVDYIKNKPTVLSHFTNDLNFIGDAPANGYLYGRKNNAWEQITSQWTADTYGLNYLNNVGIGVVSNVDFRLNVLGSKSSRYITKISNSNANGYGLLVNTANNGNLGNILTLNAADTKLYNFRGDAAIEVAYNTAGTLTPSSGYGLLYAKNSDGHLWWKNAAGSEWDLTLSGSGSGTPGGSSGSIQYNNGGAFGGFGSWNGSTMSITGAISTTGNILATGSGAAIGTSNGGSIGMTAGYFYVPNRTAPSAPISGLGYLYLAGTTGYEHIYLKTANETFDLTQIGTGLTNPMTSIGDMIYGTTGGAAARLAAGADGYYLRMQSGVPTWVASSYTLPTASNSVLGGVKISSTDGGISMYGDYAALNINNLTSASLDLSDYFAFYDGSGTATRKATLNDLKTLVGSGSTGGAPADATYITQTANASLSNEQALGGLATGIMKSTNTTGVISTVPAPNGDVVGTTDSQILTNKTISGSSNTLSNVLILTTTGTSGAATYNGTTLNIPQYEGTGGGMIYPSAGIALSTGSAWGTSITDNSANWNTAYTDRLKWDGGSTGLVASTGRTSLGGTTIGQSMFTLTNPSATTFPRFNSNNTVSALTAADFRTAIGAGTGNGTVTSFSAGDLSPLFTTAETNATTTPDLSFTLSNAAAYTVFGNQTGSSAAPSYGKLSISTINATGTPSASTYLRGDGSWATVSGGSSYWQSSTGYIAPLTISDEVRIGSITDLGSAKLQVTGDVAINTDAETIVLSTKKATGTGKNLLLTTSYAITTGSTNACFGSFSLESTTTGSNNVAVGAYSMSDNTTGSTNTAIGSGSMETNIGGYSNSAIGYFSLRGNTSGYENTSIGEESLYNNTSGQRNSVVGSKSLLYNTTGSNNIALGYYAGNEYDGGSVLFPSGCIYIGNETQSGQGSSPSNEIVIGNGSMGLGSNSTLIGNFSTTKTFLYGNVESAGSVKVSNDSSTATAANVGAIRYRTSGNNSYCEMVMQTGASTYAWVIIKQNTW